MDTSSSSLEALSALLRADLESNELWQDSMMRQFRNQYWEPMHQELSMLAQGIQATTPILEKVSAFLRTINDFMS